MKRKMKIIAAMFLCVCCIAAFITVFAAAQDYTVTSSAGFTMSYYGDDMSKAAKIMGIKEKELKDLCRKNDVLFVAVNGDNTVQIRLCRYQTDLSKKVEDISALSDSLVEELFSDISENGYVKTTLGNSAFLKTTEKLTDSGGKYVSDQYITIKNGYIYQISVYSSENADTESAEIFLRGIRINRAVVYSNKQKLLVALGIAAFLILIGFMIRGIIKDIKSEKGNTDDTQSE